MAGIFDTGIFDTGIFDHDANADSRVGGNWYPRPIIYLDDDGKEVDLREYKRRLVRQTVSVSDNEKATQGLDKERERIAAERKRIADRVNKIEAQIGELGARMRKARKAKQDKIKAEQQILEKELEGQKLFLDRIVFEAEFVAAQREAAYEWFVANQKETALRVIMIDDMITQDENAMIADIIALAQQSGLIAA